MGTRLCVTKRAALVEIHGDGPFDVEYTNPSEDPQVGAKTPYYFPKEFELNELNTPEGKRSDSDV